MTRRARWWFVVFFAAGMAWVEAATVYYLRVLVGRVDPYQANPLPIVGVLGPVELVREVATLVMLFTVGALAGQTKQTRFAYTAIAFGVWDVFYYVFLEAICGWPRSLFDWDVLFLLPVPWWGPVLAPASIALLMIVWGTLMTQSTEKPSVSPALWPLSGLGVALALYAFMADSLRAVRDGLDATLTMLPATFDWPVFLVALALLAAPVAQLAWRMRTNAAAARRSAEPAGLSPTV
jgi:hypothetical protein